MGTEQGDDGYLQPRWWRWLLAFATVCLLIPLPSLLLYVIPGFGPESEFRSLAPSLFIVLAAVSGLCAALFGIVYWRFRETKSRSDLIKTGTIIWAGAGGVAPWLLLKEPGGAIFTFPLAAVAGAAASYLFALIVDGRAGRA